jgi:hypothetical protein
MKVIRRMISGNQILDRLQTALAIPDKRGKEARLAEALDVSTSVLANWRERDAAGLEVVVELCRQRDLDLNVILLGRDPATYQQPAMEEPELLSSDIPTDTIMEIGELGKRLSELSLRLTENIPPYQAGGSSGTP